MTKAELRQLYLHKRSILSDQEVAQGNASIIQQLKQLDFSQLKVIHLFLPIAHHHEVNLWEFIHWLWKTHSHIKTVVPKCDFKKREMKTCLLTSDTKLATDNFGIPEPIEETIIDNKEIDLVITPLVLCDKQGHRVGYGKGFYDAFFKICRADVQKIGVGFFPPVDSINNVHEGDVKLDDYIY